MLTLVGVDPDVLMAHSGRKLWLSLRMRLNNRQLDSQLAGGVSPESSDVLFSRALHIVRPRYCAVLASGLRRVAANGRRTNGLSNRVPLACEATYTERLELVALAERLERPGPIRARGVAQISLLLGDGSSPMYHHPKGRRLLTELRGAADHL